MLESVAASLSTTDMLMPMVLCDLSDAQSRKRTRDGEGLPIAWEVGHTLAYRCQLMQLFGTPTESRFVAAFATTSATDGSDYPTVVEFRQTWEQTQSDLRRALEGATEATVRCAGDGPGPHARRLVLDAVAFFVFHEAYHMGVLGAVRKSIGLPGPAEFVMAQRAS